MVVGLEIAKWWMPDLSPDPFCNRLPPITKMPSARQSAASINTNAEAARCLFRKQQKDIASTLAKHLSCRLLSPNQIVMPQLPSEVTSTVDYTYHHLSSPQPLHSFQEYPSLDKIIESCRDLQDGPVSCGSSFQMFGSLILADIRS